MCVATGPLVETFVVNELIRQESFGETQVQLSRYRTDDGVEVDVIAEMTDGQVGVPSTNSPATFVVADSTGPRAGDRIADDSAGMDSRG